MKKWKKIVAVVIAIILAVALCFGGYLIYRFNCDKSNAVHSYDEIYHQDEIDLDVNKDGLFNVLKINDTHFFDGICENDLKTLNDLEAVLDKTPCDLIIVNGDLVDGFNLKSTYNKYQAIDLFARLIESYNTPWTFAPGNNDGEIDGENEDVIAYMMQYDNFICGNQKDINGSMQFIINLNYNNELAHSIAIMDSGSRKIKAIGGYDYIKQDQIDWLLNKVNEKKVKTSVFFHMPTTDFQNAYDNGEAYDDYFMSNAYPYDEIKENNLFSDSIKGNEYITLLSCAHQHSNNMCSFYDGRYYQLSSVSGYSAGHQDIITPSCTLTQINLNDDNTKTMYTFEQIMY